MLQLMPCIKQVDLYIGCIKLTWNCSTSFLI